MCNENMKENMFIAFLGVIHTKGRGQFVNNIGLFGRYYMRVILGYMGNNFDISFGKSVAILTAF